MLVVCPRSRSWSAWAANRPSAAMALRAATTAAYRASSARGAVRHLSAKPPAPPSPAELEKMFENSEKLVTQIREGTYVNASLPTMRDVPDEPLYLPKDISEVALLDEQPLEQKKRTVYIRQKPQTAMQSAASKSYAWTITWPSQTRWTNPLMGWTATADPLSNLKLQFDTPEQAIRFCKRQGWSYELSDPIDRKVELGTKKYAHNFLAENVEVKLREEGVKTKEFVQPGFSASNWFMPLKYHGDGEVEQHGDPVKGKK